MSMNDIITAIKNSNKIAILPHIMVDGDGLGSSLALAMILKRMNKQVHVYIEENVPEVYSFLPGMENLSVWDGGDQRYDLAIALDTGDMERLGKRAEILNNSPVTINIDHHKTNTSFAQYNFINESASSVGEIIFQFAGELDVDIDKDMAICLYVSISTDTGGFRYSNTTTATHQTAAELIGKGVDVAEISRIIFDTVSFEKQKLIGVAISTIELYENGSVALITIDQNILKVSGAKEEDCDGIVNYARNIRGVEVGVLIKQKNDEEIRVNLRSNRYVDVSLIAKKHGGGGHQRAAGCTLKATIEAAKKTIIDEIRNAI